MFKKYYYVNRIFSFIVQGVALNHSHNHPFSRTSPNLQFVTFFAFFLKK